MSVENTYSLRSQCVLVVTRANVVRRSVYPRDMVTVTVVFYGHVLYLLQTIWSGYPVFIIIIISLLTFSISFISLFNKSACPAAGRRVTLTDFFFLSRCAATAA